MTDQEKIKSYYSQFDEWARLDTAEGRLEFDILLSLIQQYLPKGCTVLDLGGGPGRYTAALSLRGYDMHLADLSPDLIETAKIKLKEHGDPAFIKGISVADALDLNRYGSESFDAVLLLGPLYHLTSASEIQTCLAEVYRVLRSGGILIAAYIPWLSGIRGVLARALYQSGQADADTMREAVETGRFRNKGSEGFQEGYFIKTEMLESLMSEAGLRKLAVRSVRGIGNGMEAAILTAQEKDHQLYAGIMDMIRSTAADRAVIDSSGHAVYIGSKD